MRRELVDPGEVVAGRYRVGEALGRGGMAVVYAADDLHAGGSIALKVLRPDAAHRAEAVERFRREGELLQRVSSPAIVQVDHFGKLDDGRFYIAMERLRGETFGDHLRDIGRLDPEALTPILAGIVAGLDSAHAAGVVHRDLKPENIFLARADVDQPYQVKLLDFGICKLTDSERLTRTGQILGTPRYMAPEQLSAEPDVDQRVDVYALGVILYQALAGQPPFLATTPSELVVAILSGRFAPLTSLRPDLKSGYHAVVARAMAKSRQARFHSVRELLDAWLQVEPQVALPKEVARGAGTELMGATPGGAFGDPDAGRLRVGTFAQVLQPPPPGISGHSAQEDVTELDAPLGASIPSARSGGTAQLSAEALGAAPGTVPPPRAGAGPFVAAAAVAEPSPVPHFSVAAAAQSGSHLTPAAAKAQDAPAPSEPGGSAARSPGQSGGYPSPGQSGGYPSPGQSGGYPSLGQSGGYPSPGSGGYASQSGGYPSPGDEELSEALPALPTSAGRWKLLLLALLAGALSAGVVFVVLTLMRAQAEPASSAPVPNVPTSGAPTSGAPTSGAPTSGAAPESSRARSEAAPAHAPAPAAAPEPAPTEPGSAEAPAPEPGLPSSADADAERVPSPSPSTRSTRGTRNARPAPRPSAAPTSAPAATSMIGSLNASGGSGTSSGGLAALERLADSMNAEPALSLNERMAQARAAYRSGDGARCLALLDALGAYPPSAALRLKGDCQRRAGQSAAALTSYQTFCRRFPNHFAIDEVRGLVDALGGRCP